MTIKETIEKVEAFHNAFGIENAYQPNAKLSDSDLALRHRLMAEENEEYLEAAQNGDIVEIADALGDQLYILCGTILKHGLQDKIVDVFQEIQRSNMSKLDKEALRRILTEPKNALIKQYTHLFDLDGIKLKFTADALDWAVDKAVEFELRSRGQRGILEALLTTAMFELPGSDVKEFLVDRKYCEK